MYFCFILEAIKHLTELTEFQFQTLNPLGSPSTFKPESKVS